MYPIFNNKNKPVYEDQEFYDANQETGNGNRFEGPKLPPLANYPIRQPQHCNIGIQMAALKIAENNVENHNYDDTDDDEPDPAVPQTLLTNPSDLPVPDPDYVAKLVPVELHPLIAKQYKKDCRSWLWKSKTKKEQLGLPLQSSSKVDK